MKFDATPPAASIETKSKAAFAARVADFVELTKPRILVLALLTVAVGFSLASESAWQSDRLWNVLIGVAFVAAGSAALNQWMERHTDGRMERTANRPLPAGRLLPIEVLLFGSAIGCLGVVYLAMTVNALTALLAIATLILYTLVYTPLKRKTSLCTAVGAIPGALPPVLGWTAATGRLDAGALVLFAIMFLWQFPHFLAIAWLYRHDYNRAGLRMLPACARSRVTGLMSVGYALALLPVSLLPSQFALAGDGYFLAAIVLGVGYAICAMRFMCNESQRTARSLLVASLVYLPMLLLLLTWNHFQLLS